MEQEWGHAFVHESGHALMAILQAIPCHGICYQKDGDSGKFCTLVPPKSAVGRTTKEYLFLAGGVAAEKLIYNNHDEQTAEADMRDFDSPGAPAFDTTTSKALEILSSRRRHLKRLVSLLKAKARQADFDLASLPEVGMDGSDKRYRILLGEEEIRDAVQRR